MKILHIIDSGGLYGAEVMLLNLMAEQVKLGLEPVLVSIGEHHNEEKPLEKEARRRGLQVKTFRMLPGPNIAGALRVLRYARQNRFDLLHSHGYKGNILFGFIPGKIRRLPMVNTVHGWTWTGGMTRMMIYEWLDSMSLAFMDRVVLVNEAMKDHARLRKRSRLAVEVVANGIPVESLPDSRADKMELNLEILDFCREGYTIGAIGRLSQEKGFDVLLEAVAGLVTEGRDVRLALLGEGGLRGRLEDKVKALGLGQRVLMPGYVKSAGNYLSYFKLFVMPSLTEGLPIVLLEAMRAGVPIAASRVGGIPNVLDEGRAGLLLEPGNVEALKRGIAEVIMNPAEAEQRLHAARKRVREEFSSRIMAEKYLEIYRRVVQHSSQCNRTQ
jgi:glycosyltransferase involved in cell wall biosynthesis